LEDLLKFGAGGFELFARVIRLLGIDPVLFRLLKVLACLRESGRGMGTLCLLMVFRLSFMNP